MFETIYGQSHLILSCLHENIFIVDLIALMGLFSFSIFSYTRFTGIRIFSFNLNLQIHLFKLFSQLMFIFFMSEEKSDVYIVILIVCFPSLSLSGFINFISLSNTQPFAYLIFSSCTFVF